MRKRNLTMPPSHSQAQDTHDDSQLGQGDEQIEDLDDQVGHLHTQPSSVPETQDVASSSRRSWKRRGPTYCKDTWGRPRSQRKRVVFNKFGQPVGKIGKKFTNFLGTVARLGAKLPIDQFDWSQVPNEKKEDAWEVVQDYYDVDEMHKSWTLSNIGTKWKDWKCYLRKAYFDPGFPCTDDRVIGDQWTGLCAHWQSSPAQKRSITNKANRSKQVMMHTNGTQSFACKRYDLEKGSGKVRSRPELFKLTHTKKNGKIVDKASEDPIKKFTQYEMEHPESSSSNVAISRDDAFAHFIGSERHGRVRMMGFGTTPTDCFGPSPNRMDYRRMIEEERNDKEQIREDFCQFKEEMTQQLQNFMSNFSGSQNTADATPSRDVTSPPASHPPCSSTEVILMSLARPGIELAKGLLVSEDPATIVDGTPIGPGFSLVSVRVIIVGDELLIKPSGRRKTIRDVAGGHVKEAPSN
ncbi:uncharacterized protein LOC143872124 isoform X2 [Tasmannia lanceolata]|uniref:uncharacterized protein LOC143872124 isoform X2 n=1 Tax=Tasmannia lanceolata TaxID=3420 RepID=UPI004062BA8C